MDSLLFFSYRNWQAFRGHPLWRYLLLGLLVFWLLVFLSALANATPTTKRLESREHGGFEIRRMHAADAFEAVPDDALLLSSHIDVQITGFVARTVIRQRFKNTTNDWIEGTYRFPLPDGAAVDGLTMVVGDRRIVGVIKEKSEAKRIYQEAKKAGKKAALLNQARPNMFTSKVANVAPGSEIDVELQFLSLAEQNGMEFSWRLPQAITPRYGSDGQMVDGGDQALPAGATYYMLPKQPDAPVTPTNQTSFNINLNAGTDVTSLASPSHDLAVSDKGKGLFTIGLQGGSLPADRDFVLRWTLTRAAAAKPVLFKEKFDGDTYLLGFVLPPAEEGSAPRVPPRDVAFVMDISGSMHGVSIRQAKQALLRGLDLLRPEDKFDIVLFNHETYRLFGESRLATVENLAAARSLVRKIEADGGTEMKPALASALAESQAEEGLRQIMFLTDGAIGYEDEMFRMVDRDLGRARLFTVGLGSAPNGWFMRKAAEFGRGIHVQVDHLDRAQTELERLFADMAKPSMTALELEEDGVQEAFPARLPDLFGERPAVFVAKLKAGTRKVTLSGLTRAGDMWSSRIKLKKVPDGGGLSKLWARKKVEHVTDQALRGLPTADAKAAILDVALKHAIMSPYTSFVAVEDKESRAKAEALKRAQLKGNLPAGTDPQKFFGPSTASPMLLFLLIGLVLLLVSCSLTVYARRA